MTTKLSVIMSALNGGKYIAKTIESILGQSFTDFEFIMVDDGSTDDTFEIMRSFDDDRIIILKNEENLGIAKSLNKALKQASGEYIAKMDADDISFVQRFMKQVTYLDEHPEVAVVGTGAYHIDAKGEVQSVHCQPTEDNLIRFALYYSYPFYNSTIMIRKSVLDMHDITHDENYGSAAEDYAFLSKIMPHGRLANIDEPLQYFRKHSESTCAKHEDKQLDNNYVVSVKNCELLFYGDRVRIETLKKVLAMMQASQFTVQDVLQVESLLADIIGRTVEKYPIDAAGVTRLKGYKARVLLKMMFSHKVVMCQPRIILLLICHIGEFAGALQYQRKLSKWQKKYMKLAK